ncbi:uncharacterized protein LOC143847362 [Tasmannia lanceolata]|uniref:uncharacterized protein LOC143847362 n=1 Tax=Tasmannia lanceolata TaxID=3420 RepID=UPI004063C9FA
MSRCFPFPPPGYEKKDRNDDVDLLTKEKHKEKKNKKEKEKKDKEKREGKERSKDKHREKKDRKEKHKDKKKDKEKNTTTSDDKRIEGKTVSYNGEKLDESSQQGEEHNYTKFTEELVRRIRDDRGAGNQMVETFTATDQRRIEGMGRPPEKYIEKRTGGKEKNKDKDKDGDGKMGDGHKERDERRGTGNEIFQNLFGTDQRRIEGMGRPPEKGIEKRTGGKEKNKDKDGDGKMGDGHKERDERRGTGNEIFQNRTGTDQRRIEGVGRAVEKDAEKKVDRKEKNKDKGGDDKSRYKRKDGDREEKRSKGKDKDRDKGKEKEKEKGEHKHELQDKVRDSGKKEHVDALNIRPSYPPKDREKSAATQGNLKKRTQHEINGFVHENDLQRNKFPRPTSSSNLSMENGRKLEACQVAIDRQVVTDTRKVEINKERKVNGIIEAQPPSVTSRPSISLTACENGEASTRPPHPDSKYLSQILTVPQKAEWSDFDDQEWLFSSENCLSKPKVAVEVGETPLVWADAIRIDSGDICALPYVIPY